MFRILSSQINSRMTLQDATPNTSRRYMDVTCKAVPVTGLECPEGDRGIVPLLLKRDARRGGWAKPRPADLPLGKSRYPLNRFRVNTRSALDGCRISRSYRVQTPELPGRSESLYRPRYPGKHMEEWKYSSSHS
jgi:hypothetical protein